MDIEVRGIERGRATVKPAGYLGPEYFQAYRGACHRAGARYDASTKLNILPIDRVRILKAALEEAGFTVQLDHSLAGSMAEQRVMADARLQEAKTRLDLVRAELAKVGKSVRYYQAEGILYLASRARAGLFDDMGLGKTLQALVALPNRVRCVWVCPASLKLNVKAEAAMWRPDLRVTVLEGNGSFRWPEENEVVVINYDILPGALEDFRKRKRVVDGTIPPIPESDVPVFLIADEAHAVKSGKAQRTVRLREMGRMVRATGGANWPMTGTELKNRPMDLWNLLECFDLAKDAFGNFQTFTKLMGGVQGGFGIQWTGKASAEVAQRLRSVSLKRMKRDVLKELPPKQYQQIIVEIDAKTALLCDQVVAFLKTKGIDVEDLKDTVVATKIKGAGFELISKAMTALASAKISPALPIVEDFEERGEPLIVFAAHRAPVDLIAARPGWTSITGDTPIHPHNDGPVPEGCTCRQAIVNAFQAGKYKGVAGTISAMGVGVTLTYGSKILRIDRDWTPAMNRQAEDRVNRIGQQADSLLVMDVIADHALDHNLTFGLLGKEETLANSTEAAAVKEGEAHVALPAMDDLSFTTIAPKPAYVPQAPQVWRTTRTGARVQVPAEDASRGRRPAQNAIERWAGEGLIALAGMDPDRALELNGAGFSRFDGDFGHKLAERLQVAGGLTDREWAAAVRLAKKYRRQLPLEPAA